MLVSVNPMFQSHPTARISSTIVTAFLLLGLCVGIEFTTLDVSANAEPPVGDAPILKGSNFYPLYDQESLSGWQVHGKARWASQNATLVGHRFAEDRSGHDGILLSRRSYREFTVRIKYRLEKGEASLLYHCGLEPEGDLRKLVGPSIALPPREESEPNNGSDWTILELDVVNGRASASRDGISLDTFELKTESTEGHSDKAAGRLALKLGGKDGGPTELHIAEIEIREYGDTEQFSAWIRDLGYAEHFDAPLMQIQTGGLTRDSDGTTRFRNLYGFLLQEDGKKQWCQVASLDLDTQKIEARSAGDDPTKQPAVEWKPIALERHAEQWLDLLWGEYPHERFDHSSYPPLDFPNYALVLATALRENGHWTLADRLVEKARNSRPRQKWQADALAFQKGIAENFAETELARALKTLADAKSPMSDFETLLSAIIRRFSSTIAADKAAALFGLLAQSSEKTAPFLTDSELAKLPLDARVAELIRQLETQNGHQWMFPGTCDIFLDSRGNASPAYRLVRLGHAAVPQLIAALGDSRLSRSTSPGIPYDYPLRVGDCAHAILERIAHRRFLENQYSIADKEWPQVKQGIVEWWKSVEGKSEFDILAEAVRSVGGDSPSQAANLLENYPDDGLPIIIEAARKATDPDIRGVLITVAARAGIERCGAFLREELARGPLAAGRARAAAALWITGDGKTDRSLATSAMVEDWRKRLDDGFPDDVGEPSGQGHAGALGSAAIFLANFLNVEGIEALAEHWDDIPIRQRANLLHAWSGDDRGMLSLSSLATAPAPSPDQDEQPSGGIFGFGTATGYPGGQKLLQLGRENHVVVLGFVTPATKKPADQKAAALSPARQRIEDGLVSIALLSLDDPSRNFHAQGSSGSHPRICDIAAKCLSRRRPETYGDFDEQASWHAREKRRNEMLALQPQPTGKVQLKIPPARSDPAEPGRIASVQVTFGHDTPAPLLRILDEISAWQDQALDVQALTGITEKAARALPAGREFTLQLIGDPSVQPGIDVEAHFGRFDSDLHRRDIDQLPADWLWRFYRAEKGDPSLTYSRQTQSRVFRPEKSSFDSFLEGLQEFSEKATRLIEAEPKDAAEIFVQLRRAADGPAATP